MWSPLRVLIIDDVEDDALLVARQIQQRFVLEFDRVDTEANMAAALMQKEYDAIVADNSMPRFSAREALGIYREFGLDNPFIVVSGAIGEDTAVEFMHAGAHDCIMKNNLKRLVPTLERELRETEERRSRREAEQAVRESEERHRSIIAVLEEGIILHDAEGKIVSCNASAERIVGRSASEMLGKTEDSLPWQVVHEDGTPFPIVCRPTTLTLHTGQPLYNVVMGIFRPDGKLRWISVNSQPVLKEQKSKPYAVVTSFNDITERKHAETEIARVNRTLRMLGDCNEILIRTTNEKALLDAVCRVIVEVGGYRLAWVGYAENDEAKTVRPMARAGVDSEYIDKAQVTWEDSERGRGPGGVAIRTGRPNIIQNITDDPTFAPWREEAIRRGFHSIIALPLIHEGRTFGVIGIYSAEIGVSDTPEVDILKEMTDDIAYGINALRLREERDHAAEALRVSEEQYRLISERMADVVWRLDLHTNHLSYVSPSIMNLRGFTPEEAMAQSLEEMLTPDSFETVRTVLPERIAAFLAGDSSAMVQSNELQQYHKDGSVISTELVTTLEVDEKGIPVSLVGVTRNITERKQAEAVLRESEARLREAQQLAQIGNWELDLTCNVLSWSTEIYRIFEIDSNQFSASYEAFLNTIHPEDREQVNQAYTSSLRDHTPYEIIHRLRMNDGRIKYVHERCRTDYSPEGTPLRSVGTVQDVTERHRAEEALRKSEERYREIIEGQGEGLAITDLDDVFVFSNPAADEIFGVKGSGLAGRPVSDFVSDSKLDFIYEQTEMRKAGQKSTYEIEIYRQDEVRIIQLSATPRRDQTGAVIGTFGIFRDVTDLRKAEEVSRKFLERYTAMLKTTTDGFIQTTVEGKFVDVNDAYCRMSGYSREEFLNMSVIEIEGIESAADVTEHLERLKSVSTEHFETIHRAKDGRIYPVEVNLTCLNESGVRMLFVRDISERKAAEEDIRKLSRAVEQTTSGVLITDREGVIEYANDSFCRMTGYSSEELIGRKPSVLKSGKLSSKVYDELWATILAGKEWRGEFLNRRKDGSLFWDATSITPLLDTAGIITNFLAIKDDITAQKRAEEERKLLEEQLRQSQKMDAIGRLAGGVAHDFNNILTAISGHSELALLQIKKDDPIQANLQEVVKGSERAANLTRQLLAFSRRQVIEPVVLDLNNIVNDLKRMLTRIIGEDVRLNSDLADDLSMIYFDPGQIEQVIVNLAVNARDAMPHGGDLLLATSNETLDEHYCAIHLEATPGDYVMLKVQDSGVGISDDVKMRIFEPFFTTKPKGVGTGLGLSTVYGIVKQSGGHIWVDSTLGEGSTFRVYFPRTTEKAIPRTSGTESVDLLQGMETILVVEDSEATRNTIVDGLTFFGYKVIESANGEDALTICSRNREHIHLVLSDVILPGINGLDLAQKIRELLPKVRILLMSGYTDTFVVPTKEIPFIQKPFQIRALTSKIRNILGENGS